MKYIDVGVANGNLSRETRFLYPLEFVGPGKEYVAFSNDRNCSIKTKPGTFFKIM